MIDIGHHRAKSLFIGRDLTGEAHAHKCAAMKSAAKGNHGVASRMGAGDFDRVLNGFGPRGDKSAFFGKSARDGRVETFGQMHIVFIGQHLMAGMGKGLKLAFNSRHHFGMAVPCIDHRDARCEIDVACIFDIPDLRITCARCENLCLHANASRNGGFFAVEDFVV